MAVIYRVPTRLSLGIFFSFFFFYLAGTGRDAPWNDADQMHQVAESMVLRGHINVQMPALPGLNNRFYAPQPIVASLVHVPGVLLYRAVVGIAPGAAEAARALTSHTAPAALGALGVLLFFHLCLRVGLPLGAATVSAVILAVATIAWVYARYAWSEIAQMAWFTGLVMLLVPALEKPVRRNALVCGAWCALLINTKFVFVVALAPGGVFLLWRWRRNLRAAFVWLLWVALPLTIGLLVFAAYNHARFGSFTNMGYPLSSETFAGRIDVGLWGMLLSPGKSIFLYCPPLIFGLWGIRCMAKRAPGPLALMAALALPVVLVHARLPFWSGDWAWGPRYLVFVVPAMLVPAAFLIDEMLARRRRVGLALAGFAVAAGVGVQLVGNSIHWDHGLRVAQEVRLQWLGTPNRSGAVGGVKKSRPGGACDPCFEDTHAFAWLPPFSPIRTNAWLARHVVRNDGARAALADAPWRGYTIMPMNLDAPFSRARIDWWYLDFRQRFAAAGCALLAFMLAGLAASLILWRRGYQAACAAPPQEAAQQP